MLLIDLWVRIFAICIGILLKLIRGRFGLFGLCILPNYNVQFRILIVVDIYINISIVKNFFGCFYEFNIL